jgi:hypothetical protein
MPWANRRDAIRAISVSPIEVTRGFMCHVQKFDPNHSGEAFIFYLLARKNGSPTQLFVTANSSWISFPLVSSRTHLQVYCPTGAFSLKFRPAWPSDRRIAPAPFPNAAANRQALFDQAWFSVCVPNLVFADIDNRVIRLLCGH